MKGTTSNRSRRRTGRTAATARIAVVRGRSLRDLLVASLVFALAALAALPLAATTTELESGDSYGFVSRIEGAVLLSGLEGNDTIEAEVNHPLLTGDQIATNSGRAELVLPDATVVRIGPGSSVAFDALAGAPDSEAAGTLVILDEGELQIRTPETFLTSEDLAVVTANATLYLSAPGSYRITAQGSSFTQIVVREGFAEADTDTGSEIAREGEAIEINGRSRPFVNVVAAGPADSLELWAGDLDQAARSAGVPEDVDQRIAYAAAPLQGAGEWVYVESRRAWRPYVRADWRPFRYGRWVYTPSGLTWVATAPWGWVTSHYGFWDFVPGYGWLWLPGNVYSPAGVYWYWGPTHVAWVPYGYYNRYSRGGFGFGIYGWAGGDWSLWADWTFCPTRYFGRRGYDRYWDTGRNLGRERRFAVPRGIVTTDTRGLRPERWGKPTETFDTLVRRVDAEGRGRNLPDVTNFVARREPAAPRTRPEDNRILNRERSTRSRLAPLPEERGRGTIRSRSVEATDAGRRIRSTDTSRRTAGDAGRVGATRGTEPRDLRRRSGDPSSNRVIRPRTEGRGGTARVDSGSRVRREPSERFEPSRPAGPSGRTEAAEPAERSRPGESARDRARSLGDRRVTPSGRSVGERRPTERTEPSAVDRRLPRRSTGPTRESTPVRRVLDRIRKHRESARGSSSSSGSRRPSAKPPEGRSRSVTRGSSSGSSRPSPRGSGSSARGSGSGRGSSAKASPPSRGSGNRSSGSGRSRSRSRGNN